MKLTANNKKFVDQNGHCYSSLSNLHLIKSKFENEIIYEKYVRILKRIYLYCKSEENLSMTKEFREKLFDKFRKKIERFCINNFITFNPTIFSDIFYRTLYDIFYRLKLIVNI